MTKWTNPQLWPPPTNPMAVARALVEGTHTHHHDGLLMLRHWRGGFLHWRDGCWLEDEDASIRSELYATLDDAYCAGKAEEPTPWAPNRRKIGDLLEALAAIAYLSDKVNSPCWIEGDGPDPRQLVVVANGILHVPPRHLHAHTPRLFNRVQVPFDFDADALEPTQWLEFLEGLWPDDADAIAALGEFFGYVISGATDLHKILLIIGPTRAGKGVIARVLSALVGRGNVAGPTLASLGQNFGLEPLIGKPLAVVSDARLGGANIYAIVERLLSISGEDLITVDRKYRVPWSGTLGTRFLVISNELPRFSDASGALAHRFVTLTLQQSWLGAEDLELTDKLLTELPGILNWALDGLDRLRMYSRFTEPTSSADAITALQDLASPLSAFVRDRCVTGPAFEVEIGTLFAAWCSWCEDNGRDRPGNKQNFARDLRTVCPWIKVTQPRIEGTQIRHYRGIGLR